LTGSQSISDRQFTVEDNLVIEKFIMRKYNAYLPADLFKENLKGVDE